MDPDLERESPQFGPVELSRCFIFIDTGFPTEINLMNSCSPGGEGQVISVIRQDGAEALVITVHERIR